MRGAWIIAALQSFVETIAERTHAFTTVCASAATAVLIHLGVAATPVDQQPVADVAVLAATSVGTEASVAGYAEVAGVSLAATETEASAPEVEGVSLAAAESGGTFAHAASESTVPPETEPILSAEDDAAPGPVEAPTALAHALPGPFDADALFARTRTLAFDGKRDEARTLGEQILARAPEYYDVAVFLARIDGWDGNYDAARRRLAAVLRADAKHLGARTTLVDVELWAGNEEIASEICDAALADVPGNEQLLARRAKLDVLRNSPAAPPDSTDAPTNSDVAVLRRPGPIGRRPAAAESATEAPSKAAYRATVEYFLQSFNKDFDDWHQVNVALERETDRGSVIGRVGYYNRFDDSAAMFELDWYPTIRKGTYAYLNAGVSTQEVLPDYRLAAEIFQALPMAFEASLGWRFVQFDDSTNTISPSLGWYYGNYWFLFRPLVTFVNGETSDSYVLRARRYFTDPEEYVTLNFAIGRSIESDAASQSIFRLDTIGGLAEGRKRLFGNYVAKLAVGYESQERPGRSDRGQFTFGFGLDYLF